MQPNDLIQLIIGGGRGDLVMATALIRSLKAKGVKVRCVCVAPNDSVLKNNPLIDELVTIDFEAAYTLKSKENIFTKKIFEQLAHLQPANQSFVIEMPGPDYATISKYGLTPPIEIHFLQYQAYLLGLPYSEELELYFTEEEERWGEKYKGAVLIQTSTGGTTYKDWPIERWAELAARLKNEIGVTVYQVGSPEDKKVSGLERLPSPSLLHAAAALKACRFFIGLDSFFNHVSKAVHKPSLILWASTNPLAYGYTQNINLVNNVMWEPLMGNQGPLMKCQPCYRWPVHVQPLDELGRISAICTNTVPYHEHFMPKEFHPKKEVPACIYNNSVEVAFHYAKLLFDHTK
jgi:ADP-heptose:LPS heptosyltransferase